MRKFFCFISGILVLPVSVFCQAVIEISNPMVTGRIEEVVTIPWKDILSIYPGIDTANFIVIHPKTKKQLPYQLEYRGESQVKNLVIQVTVGAKSKLLLRLQKGRRGSFVSKTYCRYVPERKDDFAWENDKIAFRMYGKALEKTPNEMAYGVDVWVKRTDRLIINDWYKKNDYHTDNGDGVDYYKVGLTLGAGDIAPDVNDTIWYPKNYRSWKVLDNGPLRSTFQLEYDEWTVASQKVKVVKTISLDAGSQLNRVEIKYFFDQTPELPVVAGIVKRKEPGTLLLDEKKHIMAYWEPIHGKDGTTGVGCLFMGPVQRMKTDKEHLLTVMLAKQEEPVLYYSGAAWNKAGIITTSEKWFDYLQSYKQKLEQPITVIVRKRR